MAIVRTPGPKSPRGRPNPRLREPPPELPPGLPARLTAVAVLADIVANGRALDDAFQAAAHHQRIPPLDERDTALARSIVVVSLRRLGTIRRLLARFLDRGWPRKSGQLEWILIATAAQVLFLDVPDHAAVNSAVQAVRLDPASQPYAALANAVARNLTRSREDFESDDPFIDTPVWLSNRWRRTYGDDVAARIALAHRLEAPLDLTPKEGAAELAAQMDGDVLDTGSVRLRSHRSVTELPGYAEGSWWVQDAAAALPARLLHVEPGERVADLCAAPGGKTAQLAAAGARVVAVDRSAERLKRFSANMERLRLEVETEVADATTFQSAPFDAILLDAPCSATGTMRRHPDVGWTKRASDLPVLTALQARMLDRAALLLRPGGRLVYCVCSLEPEEGEAQIAGLLRRNPDLVRSPIDAGEIGGLEASLTAAGELRTLPFHLARRDPAIVGLDGFFAARLIRRS